MPTWERIAEKAKGLPPPQQQELLDFAEFLYQRSVAQRSLQSVRGLCRDLGVDISAEEIDDARRELWGSFPREDV